MADSELVALQVVEDGPRPEGTATGTNLLLPPVRTTDRFAHFPEEVYDLTAESNLARFLKVLIGDAGVGQVRKRLLVARLQQNIQGIHFYDLDRFYGALFGVRRSQSEILDLDPYTQTATSDEWAIQHAKDASYRSRVMQFARAIQYGGTPTGMELVAEALLSVDCDVYESYSQADSSYQTNAEVTANYPTYADMEGVSYGTLEGEALGRMTGNSRREFVVRPKRPITQSEAFELRRVLNRLKPVDARFTIDTSGANVYTGVGIRALTADSDFWEVVPKVAARSAVLNPYQVTSVEPVEQPRPPFSAYQGEAWSYIGDVIGVSAYSVVGDTTTTMPPQRIELPDRTFIDYYVHEALLPKRHILAGRAVSDGVFVAHPYWAASPHTQPDLAPLYTDRVELGALNNMLAHSPITDALPQNPAERFWATPFRDQDDPTAEVLELRLGDERAVNFVSFEAAHFPQIINVSAFVGDDWVVIGSHSITDSSPQYLPPGEVVLGHPQHSRSGHWTYRGISVEPVTTRRLRFTLTRDVGLPPRRNATDEVPYSLALRAVDVGYRVKSLDDVPADRRDSGQVIGGTTDAVGSTVEFVLRQESAERLLSDESNTWRCEPQPVNYAVVNLYLDVRTPDGDSQVIDKFFLDPTHPGAHLAIYYTEAVGEPTGNDWYEDQVWQPVPRDYRLQKGYLHLPPTAARHFKFEFTGLTPEPFESLLPLTRTVRLFPQSLVARFTASSSTATESLPPGMAASLEIDTDVRYADAIQALRGEAASDAKYDPTEALYAENPLSGQVLRAQSWVYGFQPWHQGDAAPRFVNAQKHLYETIEIQHTTKVGFFVGLFDLKAYRSDIGADDDTTLYDEHFHDFRNIVSGFTWTFNPNALSSGLSTDVVAVSRPYASLHNVRAVQFATQQTPPVQVVPDDDFRDPALAASNWSDLDAWHKVGDATVVYSSPDHSARIVRYAVPLQRATPRTGGIVQRPHQEVFSYRPTAFVDTGATGELYGGVESPLLGVSAQGRVYAAVRLTVEKPLATPLLLQVVHGDTGAVLMETAIEATVGETVERYYPYDLQGESAVRVRVIQRDQADSQVRVDTLSLFDEGIVWEFSVNGGTTWVPALGVRNNANGIVTFPEPGNQLVWRVRGLRPHVAVNAIRIRPEYVGVQNSRTMGSQRGPNVSEYDAAPSIKDDPAFTDWTKPVPRSWFTAYKRFPTLPVEGAPNVTEFARYYGRPVADTVVVPTDAAQPTKLAIRVGTERMDFFQPLTDGVSRAGSFYHRNAVESAPVTSDEGTTVKIASAGRGVVNRVIRPVY